MGDFKNQNLFRRFYLRRAGSQPLNQDRFQKFSSNFCGSMHRYLNLGLFS